MVHTLEYRGDITPSMVKRTRKCGRDVILADNGEQMIEACRDIVDRKQMAWVNDIAVDLYSASAVMAVYNGASDKHREMLHTKIKTITQLVNFAYKVMK